jgi:type I restriction enzyme S subunit
MSEKKNTKPFYNAEIPSDWEVKTFGEFAEIVMGQSPEGNTYNNSGDGVALINGPTEFTEKYPVKVQWTTAPTKICKEGDILLCVRGSSTGRMNIANEKYCIGRGVAAIRAKKNFNHSFLEYQIESVVNKILALTTGSTFPNIDSTSLRSVQIFSPPLPEQTAIAQLLSTWDNAITKTQALLTQKEQRKKWLMQNLLTGKKRLRINDELGVMNDELKEVNLVDVFQFIKSYSVSRDGLKTSEDKNLIYCIHYGDIHALYENEFLDFSKQQNIPQLINALSINETDYLKNGDIIMADASEDYEGVGETVEVCNLGNRKAIGGLHTIVLRGNTKIISPQYAAYLFSSENVRNELRKMANGTSVYSVSKSTLQNLSLIIHNSLKEQTAISQVLQSADTEIQLLKNKMEKLREQKKGLMQILLTGKKRLAT